MVKEKQEGRKSSYINEEFSWTHENDAFEK